MHAKDFLGPGGVVFADDQKRPRVCGDPTILRTDPATGDIVDTGIARPDHIIDYVVWQWEICPKTQRRHIQGYLETNRRVSLSTVQRFFGGNTCHWQVRKGTQKQAADYCRDIAKREPGTEFTEEGTPHACDATGVLAEFFESVQLGEVTDYRSAALKHPKVAVMYGNTAEKYLGAVCPNPMMTTKRPPIYVHVYVGAAGCGKSTLAREEALAHFQPNQIWYKGKDKWWGSTHNHYESSMLAVVIDDFDPSFFGFREFIKVLSNEPMEVEYKGGTSWAGWTHVYITTNIDVDRWYADYLLQLDQIDHGSSRNALWRRITKITKFVMPPQFDAARPALVAADVVQMVPYYLRPVEQQQPQASLSAPRAASAAPAGSGGIDPSIAGALLHPQHRSASRAASPSPIPLSRLLLP